MKPIEDLTNVDKAKILFQLFPKEMPALIEFITSMCITIKEDEQVNRSKWDNGFMDFDYYLSLIGLVQDKIARYGKKLHSSYHLFGDQLFDGMLAIFANHCIRVYVTTRQHPNKRFITAIDLLYDL